LREFLAWSSQLEKEIKGILKTISYIENSIYTRTTYVSLTRDEWHITSISLTHVTYTLKFSYNNYVLIICLSSILKTQLAVCSCYTLLICVLLFRKYRLHSCYIWNKCYHDVTTLECHIGLRNSKKISISKFFVVLSIDSTSQTY